MTHRRWPWLLSALLSLSAAGAAGYATYLAWLPCRGSMLSSTALEGFGVQTAEFSDACLRRMDTYSPMMVPDSPIDPVSGSAGFGLLAGTLIAAAWLVVVLQLRCLPRTRIVAVLPAVVALLMAGLGFGQLMTGIPMAAELSGVWMWLIDGTVLGAAVQILGHQSDLIRRRSDLARLLLALFPVGALGFVHLAIEMFVMTTFSGANWDIPPGTGYLTAAALVVSALGVLVLTLRPRPLAAEPVTEELLLIH